MKNNLIYQSLLFAILCTFISPMLNIAYAELVDCQVGDNSTGLWILKAYNVECLLPGPHAEDSYWPSETSGVNEAWTISGYYKTMVHLRSSNSIVPPSSRGTECIQGFAEARAAAECAYWRAMTDRIPGSGWSYKWIPLSNTCIEIATWISTGEEFTSYQSFYDYSYDLYEWKCNPHPSEAPVIENNGGPSCPQDQCCQ